jgi:hypothetical protein
MEREWRPPQGPMNGLKGVARSPPHNCDPVLGDAHPRCTPNPPVNERCQAHCPHLLPNLSRKKLRGFHLSRCPLHNREPHGRAVAGRILPGTALHQPRPFRDNRPPNPRALSTCSPRLAPAAYHDAAVRSQQNDLGGGHAIVAARNAQCDARRHWCG